MSSLFCTQCPSSVMATTPARLSEPMGASSSPAMFLVMAPATKTLTTPCRAARSRMSATVPAVSIGRRRVGHANDGRETAARGGGGAGGDGFLCRLARLAQMNVQVNQAGTNHEAAHVHFLGVARRLVCRVRADRGDFTFGNQNVRLCVEAVGRVHDAPTGKKQRCHARRGYTRDIDNASAGIMIDAHGRLAGLPRRSASAEAGVVQW